MVGLWINTGMSHQIPLLMICTCLHYFMMHPFHTVVCFVVCFVVFLLFFCLLFVCLFLEGGWEELKLRDNLFITA